jgi:hypothetical protein
MEKPSRTRQKRKQECDRSQAARYAAIAASYPTLATRAQQRRRQRGAFLAVKRPKPLRWLEAVVEQNAGDKSPLVLSTAPEGGILLFETPAKYQNLGAWSIAPCEFSRKRAEQRSALRPRSRLFQRSQDIKEGQDADGHRPGRDDDILLVGR